MSHLPIFDQQQIVGQIIGTRYWIYGDITYSMPATGAGIYNDGVVPLSDFVKAQAREAFELWDDVIANSLTEIDSVSPNISLNATTTLPDGIAGVAFKNPETFPEIVWSRVWIRSTSNPTLGSHSFGTILHEIGHALGLSHPGPYNGAGTAYETHAVYAQDTSRYTVMSYFAANADGSATHHAGYEGSTPLLHDILAIQARYGADTTTRTGDTTYGFNSNAGRTPFDFSLNSNPIVCIWDAGGNDTLDLSGFFWNATAYLDEGAFSSVAGLTNNISIAFGAVIENLRGGFGDDTLAGNAQPNHIWGGAGNDRLDGRGSGDWLYGGEGDDTFDADYFDTLEGNAGNDYYLIGGTIARAIEFVVHERSGEGIDTIEVRAGGASLELPSNVENGKLYLRSGDGNITGNALNNVLTGNHYINVLVGRDGADSLDGGSGVDTMIGGAGGDAYFVRDAGDRVIEAAGAGTDAAHVFIADYALAANVENLVMREGSYRGIGNDLGNLIRGSNTGDAIGGLGGNDNIHAGAGNDVVYGHDGSDVIDGGTGADLMYGGTGDDQYILDNTGDYAYEGVGAGNDLVRSSLAVTTLAPNVENLLLLDGALRAVGNALANQITGNGGANNVGGGDGHDVILGNAGNDVLYGNGGDDTLSGGAGTDTLVGGAGSDRFRYTQASQVDVIADFVAGIAALDVIDLRGTGVANFMALRPLMSQGAGQTFVTITFAPGAQLFLQNVSLGSLVAGDFVFA